MHAADPVLRRASTVRYGVAMRILGGALVVALNVMPRMRMPWKRAARKAVEDNRSRAASADHVV